jgi:hypothetical protein
MAPDDLVVRFEEGLKDKGWPTLDDLNSSRSRVFVNQALVESAAALLARKRLCLIRGAEGRGKTVLARLVGKRLREDQWDVWILDLASWQDTSNVIQVIETIGWRRKRALVIVENAHRADGDLLAELVDLQSGADFQASFLFTTRWIPGTDESEPRDPLRHVVEAGWSVDLNPDVSVAEQVILKTVGSYVLDERDRQWIVKEIGSRPNLRRLRWYLDVWLERPPRRRLAEVARKEVYDRVRAQIIQKLPIEHREALILASAILQLDVEFDPLVLDAPDRDALEREKPFSLTSSGYYRIAHASDAALVTEAAADAYRLPADTLTARMIRNYVQRLPRPRNYARLLRCLLQHENEAFARSLAESDLVGLTDAATDDRIWKPAVVLEFLLKTQGQKAAVDFWKQYEASLARHRGGVQAGLRDKIREITAGRLLSLLALLGAVDRDLRRPIEEACSQEVILEKMRGGGGGEDFSRLMREDFLCRALSSTEWSAQALAARVAGWPLGKILALLSSFRPKSRHSFLVEFGRCLRLHPEFLEKSGSTPYDSIRKLRGRLRKADPELCDHLDDIMPEDLMAESLSRATLSNIAFYFTACRAAGNLTDTVSPRTKEERTALTVLRKLSAGNLAERLSRVRDPVGAVGKFLGALARVRVEPTMGRAILDQIGVLLSQSELQCKPVALCVLLTQLKKLDECLWGTVVRRLADGYDVLRLVPQLDSAAATLLWHIGQVDATRALQIANAWFALDPCTVMRHWRSDSYSQFGLLLCNLATTDLPGSRRWVQKNSPDQWFETLRGDHAQHNFSALLWLYLIDTDLARSLLDRVVAYRYAAGAVLVADDLSLVGLKAYAHGGASTADVAYPTARKVAEWLAGKHPFPAWAFSVYAIRNHSASLASETLELAARYMHAASVPSDIGVALTKTVQPALRAILSDAVQGIALPTEAIGTPRWRKRTEGWGRR